MKTKQLTRKQLTDIAQTIIQRQFPEEWNKFKRSMLPDLIDGYRECINDDFSLKEALVHFKISVFEVGKWCHEGKVEISEIITLEDAELLEEMEE
ncbi:MAG: hypothetical protein IKD76_04035 [Clostridia bacterium]|nr:hypothetical protein [Clostridia bacterium]